MPKYHQYTKGMTPTGPNVKIKDTAKERENTCLGKEAIKIPSQKSNQAKNLEKDFRW